MKMNKTQPKSVTFNKQTITIHENRSNRMKIYEVQQQLKILTTIYKLEYKSINMNDNQIQQTPTKFNQKQ